MRVRWLRAAIADLDAQFEHIAKDNPPATFRAVLRLRRTVDLLEIHTGIGRLGEGREHANSSFLGHLMSPLIVYVPTKSKC